MNKQILLFVIVGMACKYKDKCENDGRDFECGSDGRTYLNDCYRETAGVELAYAGRCRNCESCPGARLEVCGNDGRTYLNSCWAECNGAIVIGNGECKKECNCISDVK